MSLRLVVVFILAYIMTVCDLYGDDNQHDFRLGLIAGSIASVDELKERWFFCEKCLNDFQCKFDYVEQCKSVTIPERNNALSLAVTHANTEAVYFLVNQAKTDVNGITGRYHETPLMIAAYYGTKKHQEIASFLISRGANVNAIDLAKMTILQTAIWKNNMDFVKMLLENGADPSLTYNGKKEGAACMTAIRRKRFEFISIIPGCCSLVKDNSELIPNNVYVCQ
ncbi:ankyrin repeat domain-containing protein [Salmonella sp. 741265052_HSA]|uniref:ankyrin repeat domain-containing protein n=1 Tax=Salmonella sp. 741265052_HSA TaxID=3388977 RepID=UPI001D3CDBB4|nr:ankyrin repeat domain-containing protein [Salmonella enterica]